MYENKNYHRLNVHPYPLSYTLIYYSEYYTSLPPHRTRVGALVQLLHLRQFFD